MEPNEYLTLYETEAQHWWFRAMRGVLRDALVEVGIDPGKKILDAGCGTGQNVADLRREFDCEVQGADIAPEAAIYWKRRGLKGLIRASVNELPYPGNSFDVVISIDVLECDEVNEEKAYSELWRVTRPGGTIILVVPAFRWLNTESHHRAVHASRRYSRTQVVKLLRTRPMRILRLTHLFGLPFPFICAVRLALRILGGRPAKPRSELFDIPALANDVLARLMDLERRLVRRIDVPFGSSILAVVRRENG